MKRKDGEVAEPQEGGKKLKKSVNFAPKVHVREIPNKNDKPETLVLKEKKKLKKKKAKFEKSTLVKRLEKLTLKKDKVATKKSEKPSILKNSDKKSDKPSPLKKTDKFSKSKLPLQKGKPHLQSNETPGEKVDWIDFKKKKKALKEQRKVKKLTNLYEITVQAKKIAEKLRLIECATEDRLKLSTELHELLKGHYSKFIFTHDMSRVIQWLIKYSNAQIRQAIKSELEPLLMEMFQSKYAKNCVKAAFQYGSDQLRKELLAACSGHVVKLSSHLVSAPIFEYAITEFATDADKNRLKQEFYGDMYKQAKDENVKSLEDVFKSAADMKKATLSAVKANLIRIFNKKLGSSPIVQTVLWEYLSSCSAADRDEMLPMLRTLIVDLSKTRDGTMAGIVSIWHGSNKDRKIIMKTLKEHTKEICISEHGHLLFFALIDCVDDTVVLKKIILSEILSNLAEIVHNEYGRRVILYLVARRDTHYFHPALVDFLKKGDGNAFSKKSADVREKEVLESVIEKLLESVVSETSTWLSNAPTQMVTLAILKSNYEGDLKPAFEAIADFILNPDSKIVEEEKEHKPIEHAGLHLILKKLIQLSQVFLEKKRTSFGQVLAERLDKEILENWIQVNRGCFLLILILENSTPAVVSTLSDKLESVKTKLKSLGSPGSKILIKKINR
ncbi:pumilio homolog 3 [Belonocnema kinseyi]|uniref:pumilio homolog 3 n=1 Tax=Belonocnema kinseyi TaxID=2817044 RepID=UPI00143D1FE4|nr:pumilio homolog 3 [Belonocnema kinseyi]XP_033222258.1 pumilio homolog 3 [Belonocnema kinseyi]